METGKLSKYEALICLFLSGEAGPDDAFELMEAMESDKEVKDLYDSYEKSWNLDTRKPFSESINVDAAIDQFFQETDRSKSEQKKIEPKSNKSFLFYFYRVAAIFVLIAGLGFVYKMFNKPVKYIEVSSMDNRITPVRLEDGSNIKLNKETTLKYHPDFEKKREVHLSGEAYFEVEPKEGKEFIVHAKDVDIVVIGTSFNVKAMPDSAGVEVSVISGKVEVINTQDAEDKILLNENEAVVYNEKDNALVVKEEVDINQAAWVNRRLVFEESPLSYVSQKISEIYQVNLIFASQNAEQCKLSAEFDNKKLDEIIEVLKFTFGFEVENKNDTFVFKGDSCVP